jgi:hypothetical protein
MLRSALLLMLVTAAPIARGQTADSLRSPMGRGIEVILTNSGFGLGGFLGAPLGENTLWRLEAGLGVVKDEREVAFFDRFGGRDVPNKANYLLELPVQVGLERRLFASRIEADFRPFVSVAAGPVLGWVYPYYDDENENGTLDTDEPTHDVISGLPNGTLHTGLTLSAHFGARFGPISRPGYGVRFGYRMTQYRQAVALLDGAIRPAQRRFGSPVITVYFGRLGR